MRHVAAAMLLAAGCRHQTCPVLEKPAPTVVDSGAAAARVFPRLKELAGTWVAGDTLIALEVISKGSALAQRSGFFVVWYLDGEALGGSLFPDDGYHARLRSTKIADAGELTIEMAIVDVGNVGSDMPLARSMTMTVSPQNDRIAQRWVFGTGAPVELVMTRVPESKPND